MECFAGHPLALAPRRMLLACEAMKKGGWWVAPKVNVKKAVGVEFVVAIAKSFLGLA